MANENKLWAPVFDADRRPVTPSTLDELENVGVTFNAYGLKAGQLIIIAANPQVEKQAPRREGQRPTYLVACTRDGQKSWFNPSSLLGLDAKLNPLYPEWANLGGAKAIVEKIIEMGGIKCGAEDKMFEALATKFNRDGTVREEVVRDEKGEIKLNADGTPEMVRATETRKYVSVPSPAVK